MPVALEHALPPLARRNATVRTWPNSLVRWVLPSLVGAWLPGLLSRQGRQRLDASVWM